MEFFVKIFNDFNPLTIFEKSSILDGRLCSAYAFEFRWRWSVGWQGTKIPDTHEKSTKNQSVTEWNKYGEYGAMSKNVECLCYREVKAVE